MSGLITVILRFLSVYVNLYSERRRRVGVSNRAQQPAREGFDGLTQISFQSRKITYRDLITFHLGNLAAHLEADGWSQQAVNNHRTTIRRWMVGVDCTEDSLVGEELGLKFPDALKLHLEALEGEGKEYQTLKDRKWIMNRWQESFCLLLRSDGLPDSFSDALAYLLKVEGRPYKHVGIDCGIKRENFGEWIKGHHLPSARSYDKVCKLENYFRLQPGTLLTRLPSFLSGMQMTQVATCLTPFRKNQQEMQQKVYSLKKFVPELDREWKLILKFHTDSAWVAAQGLLRSGRGWKFIESDRRQSTASSNLGKFQDFFGFLMLPKESEDPHLSGLGFKEEDLTFALFTDSELIYHFIKFRQGRTVRKVYNHYAQAFLRLAAHLVRPKYGVLWQLPTFGLRLPQQITEVKRWRDRCGGAHERIVNIEKNINLNEGFNKSNDTLALVKPLIRERQHPITILLDIIDGIRFEFKRTLSKKRRAVLFRDILMFDFLMSNPVRVGNLAGMRYVPSCRGNEDDPCNLYRKSDGSWHLKYEVLELKNGYFRGRYDLPVNPLIWPDIEEYLSAHRPLLADAKECTYVFRPEPRALNKFRRDVQKGRPMNSTNLSNRVLQLSQLYLPGCLGFSAQAARHFAATEWLKNNPGAYAVAAAILHDSEEIVKENYSWVEPKDMILFWNNHLGDVVKEARKAA